MTPTQFGRDTITPWTQQVAMRWRPEVRFIEARVEVLKLLEQKGRLRSFKLGETEITVRLSQYSELDVSVDRLVLRVLSPLESMDVPLSAVKDALETIRPTAIRHIDAAFTHVVEVIGDYDQLRQLAGEGLFPWWPAPITDWALLVDGTSEDGRTTSKCEFGVINREEAVERVTRSIGRTSGPQLSSARPYIQGLPVPEVALFADSNWERDPRPPVTKEAAWDYFATFVQGVTAEANALVLRLHAAVTSSVTTATKLSASR